MESLTQLDIPDRHDYLAQQHALGRKIMGVFPSIYPRELLWTFDILPAEIWDPQTQRSASNAHLQASICPVVRRGLDLMLSDSAQINAGYLFPHTCDSIQNLGSQVNDLIGSRQSIRGFYLPKAVSGSVTERFYKQQIHLLHADLEREHGSIDHDKFLGKCRLGKQIDDLWLDIRQARAAGNWSVSNVLYFKLQRAAEYMQPEDYLRLLQTVDLERSHSSTAAPILLSGILPLNPDILAHLDSLNIHITCDDLLSGGRRLPQMAVDLNDDPLQYLSDRFFMLPPCSTRSGTLDLRIRYLKQRLQQMRGRGVLFNIVTFCEPELFDSQAIIRAFKQESMPVLKLETELEAGISGQIQTRLEAFAEILAEGQP